MSQNEDFSRGEDAPFKVRPYALVGGRTRARLELAIETVVLLTEHGESQYDTQRLEYKEVLDFAREPVSIAEISARSGTAIGATKVLVADLVSDGLLTYSASKGELPDIEIMRKVVDGLNAL